MIRIAPQYGHRSAPSSRLFWIRAVLNRSNVMFWTGFLIGFAACLAIGLTVHFVHDWHQRKAFIASLLPTEREKLRGFETVKGDWHGFRNLLHR
jgi:hypothetical protein